MFSAIIPPPPPHPHPSLLSRPLCSSLSISHPDTLSTTTYQNKIKTNLAIFFFFFSKRQIIKTIISGRRCLWPEAVLSLLSCCPRHVVVSPRLSSGQRGAETALFKPLTALISKLTPLSSHPRVTPTPTPSPSPFSFVFRHDLERYFRLLLYFWLIKRLH